MPVGLPEQRLRAAQMLVALGPARATSMLRELPPDKVHSLVADMATIDLTPEDAREVLKEITIDVLGKQKAPAGLDLAKTVLTNLYGEDEATRLGPKIDPRQVSPFAWMADLDPNHVVTALADEPPATSAVALAHLQPALTAKLLRKLKDPVRSDIALRMASLNSVAPDVVAAIDKSLRKRLAGRLEETGQAVQGVDIIVEVLTRSSPKVQKAIVESIRERDAQLAMDIQERLFVFDDIVQLDDSGIQQVLKSIETMDLAFSLHSAKDEIRDLVFRNLSERARDSLIEEIDYLSSPKAAEVKAAKARIVTVIRELEESGAIEIARPGAEDIDDDEEDD